MFVYELSGCGIESCCSHSSILLKFIIGRKSIVMKSIVWSKFVSYSKLRTADLVPFTEEILNGKLHFFCKELYNFRYIRSSSNTWNLVFFHVEFNISRTSYRRCSLRKDALTNFTKFTRKHLRESQSLFNKVADWGLQLYYKREAGTGVFLWILWNF